MSARPKADIVGRIAWETLWVTQFRAAPYRLRTATHRLPISSCGAAAKVAPHFHKAAAFNCWGRSHSRIAAYLHGIRPFIVSFRSKAVAVSPLVMHISATTVNDRIMSAPWLCSGSTFRAKAPQAFIRPSSIMTIKVTTPKISESSLPKKSPRTRELDKPRQPMVWRSQSEACP